MAQKITLKKGAAKKSVVVKTKASPPAKAPKHPLKAERAKVQGSSDSTKKPVPKNKVPEIILSDSIDVVPELLPILQVKAEELLPAPKATPPGVPLAVTVQTSQGLAVNGSTHPANLLVIVTCGGWPVTELTKDHFTLMEHFEVPGQGAPFSNNITSFRNAGTGAYLLQIRPINGAPWRSGHHLGQLLISTAQDQQGQAAFKLIIR